MERLSEEQTRDIGSRLQRAGATLPCPRCGASESAVADGYILEYLQSQLRNMTISSDNRVACVATVCNSCGYLAQHLLRALNVVEV